MEQMERDFREMMLGIYRTTKNETGHKATGLLQLIDENGGVGAAKALINANSVSAGYTFLSEQRRLDLTVEAKVLEHTKFHSLFSGEELQKCRDRLEEYN